MRRRIKPIVVVVFFALCGLFLVIGKAHSDSLQKQQLASAKDSIPTVSSTSTTTTSTSETDENFVLKPILISQVGNFQAKLTMILYLKIFLVLSFVFMEGHKSVKIAMPLIQLVLINHLRHISKNYRNENVPVAVL